MGTRERKEREKEQRANMIVDAAQKLFLTKGFIQTTMDDIAGEAELSKGTLYLYYKSKEDLYHAIVLRGVEILLPLLEKAADKCVKGIDKIMGLFKKYADFANSNSDFVTIFSLNEVNNIANENTPNQEKLAEANKKLLKLMVDSIKTGISDGSIRKAVNPIDMSLILTFSSQSVLRLCARADNPWEYFNSSPSQLIESYFDSIYFSLKTEK